MPRRTLSLLDLHNLFGRGKLYVIRKVQEDWICISRLRRRRGNFMVSDYYFQKRVGYPEMCARAKVGDLAYKGYGVRWRLIRKIFRRDIAEE
jgi:hypothetical protein